MKKIPLVTPRKKRILVWSDSCLATTGFGIVASHIMKALQATGRYEIEQLAINHFVEFWDTKQIPYSISPARLRDPRDPYGKRTFLDLISKRQYDFVFIINDTFVLHDLAEEVRNIKSTQKFCLIYYYPVDCTLRMPGMIGVADIPVAYTNFAAEETGKVLGWKPETVIHHGVDTGNFFPIDQTLKEKTRKFLFNCSQDTFVVSNINRNTLRKDIPATIAAFSEFRREVPNSILYLHMMPQDSSGGYVIDLLPAINHLGLKLDRDVFFPRNYSPVSGFPVQVLNQIFGASDVMFSTHLGEGYSLTVQESMACGVPVIVPDNTVTPELVTGRGYVYPCRELAYIDGSGMRKKGRVEDMVSTLMDSYKDWRDDPSGRRRGYIQAGLAFARDHSWTNITKQWLKVFRTPVQKKEVRMELV